KRWDATPKRTKFYEEIPSTKAGSLFVVKTTRSTSHELRTLVSVRPVGTESRSFRDVPSLRRANGSQFRNMQRKRLNRVKLRVKSHPHCALHMHRMEQR